MSCRLFLALVIATGCRSYQGTARDVAPATLRSQSGWLLVDDVPFFGQESDAECGPAVMAMVVSHWTGAAPQTIAAQFRPVPARGLAAAKLRDFAKGRGLASFLVVGELDDLVHELEAGRPIVVGMVKQHRKAKLQHYEVVVGIHRQRKLVATLDPAAGWRQNTFDGFVAEWAPSGKLTLIVAPRQP